ncbi:tetratricopeptide repeat protein [Streptomyces roseirectus]|uniref:Tetratricopeptide repeat protein n=1 Tax=Streptomyces roseirectus TaxID=2768066 RepID=A0A7H0ITK8_9ACTN|nr:BTAD domain-containing putative transcriptional regulator [Streptomyces roseirectus]QNP76124.1 tetratricopeptide repeat protein [Streptomyces roseirectus]
MADFLLLGTVESRSADGTAVDLGPAKQRTVLAALLVDAGRWVTVETLIDRVWGEDPPAQVRPSLYAYVARIRRLLASTAEDAPARPHLRRGTGGYLLDVPLDHVDVHRFRHLVEQARRADCPPAERIRTLREALALWRGEPLAGLPGAWAQRTRYSWQRHRIEAVVERTDAELALGRHTEVIGAMTGLLAEHPLVEPFAVALMRALHAAGRSPEALAVHAELRERLAEELGADPGAEVRQVHEAILRGEPAQPARTQPVPAQLPLEARGFTGRAEELARLDDVLAAGAERPAAVVISAIAGAGGIGKTWLALHWAHRRAEHFPDGQLFVDLLGFNPSTPPMQPATALRGFLEALGVAPGAVPSTLHGQTALYRSLLAGRRMLVVLDNAGSPDQVVPLLPGNPDCVVLVTSRRKLTELAVRHGARPLGLDALNPDDARRVLDTRLGAARTAAEPDAVDELLALCDGYPLALGIIVGRAACAPRLPLAQLAAELRESTTRLDALDDDMPTASLPQVLSWSYRALAPVQARLFALLGLVPGPEIGLPALASLADLPGPAARTALRGLENLHLVEQYAPERWRMHDLVRLYAADRGRHDLPPGDRDAALRRLTEFYLHTTCATRPLMQVHETPHGLGDPVPGCRPQRLTTQDEAVRWLAGELPNLLAAQRLAADRGWRRLVWQFVWSLDHFHSLLGHVRDRMTMCTAALAALDPDDPLDVHVMVHRQLGHAAAHVGAHDEATEHLTHALNLAEQADDHATQARIHISLAQAYGQRDHLSRALDHATRALELHRHVDQPVTKATALNSVGWYNARLGRYDQAREHCEAALELSRHIRHGSLEADTLDSLGYIAHHTGHHLEAVDHYRLAAARYRALGGDYWAADTLDRLGHAYHALGRPDQARATWQEAATLYRDQHRPTHAERVQRQLDALELAGAP